MRLWKHTAKYITLHKIIWKTHIVRQAIDKDEKHELISNILSVQDWQM